MTLALVTGAPIYVSRVVLEQATAQQSELSDLLEEAANATDDAHTIAGEARARIAANAAELAERRQRSQ